MKNVMIGGLVVALALVLGLEATARIGRQADPKLAHMVFFWLKDHSKAVARQVDRLVREAAQRPRGRGVFLDWHPGRGC